MIIIIHSKYFAVFDWLQSPQLILHNQNGAYHNLKDASNIPSILLYIWLETRLINDVFDWKRGCMDNRPLINRLKRICAYILKLCRKIGRSLKESLQGGKLVKNLQIFWKINKTIIELRFCAMWRIIQPHSIIINYIQNPKETVYSKIHYLFQQVCNKESENWSVFYTLFKKTR